MKCDKIREEMLDLMTPGVQPSAEVQTHLSQCAQCSEELASLQQTMALLDEWKAPEPSPYFDTRLQALLREEKAKAAEKRVGIFDWFRKPVMAGAAAVALIVGAGVYAGVQNGMLGSHGNNGPVTRNQPVTTASDPAIKDLQTLDSDQDVINNFAALDDDPSNDDQSAGTAE